MTAVDLAVLLAVLLSSALGWVRGLSRTAGGLAGLVAGFAAGSWLAGRVAPAADPLLGRIALEAGCVLGAVLVGTGVGARLGSLAGRALRRAGLRRPDQAAGAVLGAGTAGLAVWALVGASLTLGSAPVTEAVRSSAAVSTVSTVFPDAAGVGRELVRALGVPAELSGLVPAGPTAPPATGTVRRVARGAAGSVVAVTASGCGTSTSQGSGFYAAAGLVLTNAHVVAGQPEVTVSDTDGGHSAAVVGYDPDADVAVLRVTGSRAVPLAMRTTAVANGSTAVVMGHPGGGPLRAVPAVVVQQIPVVGHRVGGDALVTRAAYRIRAGVRSGNSGGPLLDTTGRVVGIVNARSLLDDDSGFALTLSAARHDLGAARTTPTGVSTGACTDTPPD